MAPKDVHTLIPRTCEYVPLGGKKRLCKGDYVKDLEVKRATWIIQMGPVKSRQVLMKGRQEDDSGRRINGWRPQGSRCQPIKNVFTLRTAPNGMCQMAFII